MRSLDVVKFKISHINLYNVKEIIHYHYLTFFFIPQIETYGKDNLQTMLNNNYIGPYDTSNAISLAFDLAQILVSYTNRFLLDKNMVGAFHNIIDTDFCN